jgi:hypothetical protein
VTEGTAVRLAVARLTEAGAQAAALRPVADRPLQGYCLLSGDEEENCRITVYLENGQAHTAFLEGTLVWLPQEPGVLTIPVVPGAEPVLLPDPVAERAEPQAGTAEVEATTAALLAAEPAQPGPTGPESELPEDAEVAGQAEPGEQPDVVGFKLYPEPAIPVGAAAPGLTVPLAGRHPLAPRAAGTAMLSLKEGTLTLHLRGLPTPAALGRAETTGRPLNAYRAWLVSQRTGLRQDLGLCARVWGENFRLEAEPGLELGRYDQVLVTAEDRGAPAPSETAPQVLLGGYQLR